MAGFTLRPATLEDAATLADLGRRTFLETFGTLYDPADLTAFFDETYGEALQRAELEDPARPALVMEQEGLPVGFAQLRIGHPEASVRGFRPAEIQRIYLLKGAQGGGGGAALMQACEDLAAAREADVLWLGVWEGNTKALAFYARMGFREVGEHPFTIGKRTDRDLILMKDLS